MYVTAAASAGSILAIAVFIGALFFAVMFHEFGHYVAARWAGMRVTEFFFGFGPRRVVSFRPKQKVRGADGEIEKIESDTEFGIKPFPVGGYVKIAGMNPYEPEDPGDEGRRFKDKPPYKRAIVLMAGPVANLLTAYLLLTGMAIAGALPEQERPVPVVAELADAPPGATGWTEPSQNPASGDSASGAGAAKTPAAEAGLESGDRFIAVNGKEVQSWPEVREAISANRNHEVVFTIERDGQLMEKRVTIGERPPLEGEDGPQAFIGIRVATERRGDNPIAAAERSGRYMFAISKAAIVSVGRFFTPSNLKRYVGLLAGNQDKEANDSRFVSPVGVGRMTAQAQEQGWVNVLFVIVIFNLFLGLFNLLPLFPLDGGHLAVVIYEKIASLIVRRKVEVDVRKLIPVAVFVIGLFLFIGLTALYLDITNPIQNPFR